MFTDTMAEPRTYLPEAEPGDVLHAELEVADRVIVCLGSLSVHVNGSPIFGCLVYGPFTESEVAEKEKEIRRIEGGATLVRPLVDLHDVYRRMSAD